MISIGISIVLALENNVHKFLAGTAVQGIGITYYIIIYHIIYCINILFFRD